MSKQKLTETKLYIKGMHCPACEILIEKELLAEKEISYAEVSLSDNSATIYHTPGSHPDLKKLNKRLKKSGYKILLEAPANQAPKTDFFKSLTIALTVIFAFYLFEQLELGKYVSIDQTASLSTFFILGLVASASSCAALIGGVVLSLNKKWQGDLLNSHGQFHTGRIVAFILLGGILGAIGSAISFQSTLLTAILVILISLVMLIVALQMLNISWAQKIRLTLPKLISSKVANKSVSKSSPLIIGALTFFLPCGFTIIAQGAALASGSFLAGALIMLSFAIGTLPALLLISFTSISFGSKPHLSVLFNQVVGIILVFFAIYNINSQFNVLNLPSLSDLFPKATQEKTAEPAEINYQPAEGEQIVILTASDFDYFIEGESTFTANQPTKLVVNNQDAYGCAVALQAFGLMDDFQILEPGENIIDLGSPAPGSYKITCSMGMVQPVTITFE